MVDELECVASVLLAISFGHLAGASNISWAAFSGYMVMRGHIAESFVRGLLRIVGTAAGAGIVLLITPYVAASAALSAGALAAVGGSTLYGAITARRGYAWLFVGLTFAMILLDKLQRPSEAVGEFARTRMVEVVAGTAACVVVSTVSTLSLRRRWPGERRPPPEGLGWHPEAARHAGQAAVALALLPFLSHVWRGPDLAQAAVTIMAVMIVPAHGIGASGFLPVSRRILLRVGGCAVAAGMAAAFLFLAHSPAIAPYASVVLVAGTILGVALGRHIENGQTSLAYAGTQFVLAILVTLVPDSYAGAHLGPARERLVGILAGILLLEPVLAAWHVVSPTRRPAGVSEPAEPGGA